MSCFDVQILDSNINTIEIETCIGDQPASIDILTYDNTSLIEINHCVALLPSEINDLITVKDILAGSGISVSDSSGIYTVSLSNPTIYSSGIVDFLESVQDVIGNSGLVGGNYININYDDSSGYTTISATGLQPSGNYSIVGHTHLSTDITDSTSFGRNILTASSYAAQNKLSWQIVGSSITAAAGGQYIIPTNFSVPNTLTITDPSSPSHGDWYVVIKPSGAGGGIGGTVIGGTTYSSASGLYLYRVYSNDSGPIPTTASWKNYSLDKLHYHVASDITNFDSAVSGLLPVKNISAGSGIGVTSVSGDFTVSVTGTFGLTSEEVDDRVSNLLLAGNYINLNYNDLGNSLTISVTGVQPSGNYSTVGHTHSTSDITNFASGVSGLLPSVSGSGYIVSSFTNNTYTLSASGLQPSGNYSVVGHSHVIADVSGLQNALDSKQPSGVYASGIHYHISSDITDFNSAVSGLIPPSNFTSLSGINGIDVSNSGTDYTVALASSGNFNSLTVSGVHVSVSGHNHVYTDITNFASGIEAEVTTLLAAGNYIDIDYDNLNDTLTINATGLQPSGNYSVVGHTHTSSEITDFNSGVSGLLPSVTGTGYVTSSFAGNIYTIGVTGLQPSGNYSLVGHTHSSSNITDFNSAVSGLLPVKNIVAGTGIDVASLSGTYTIAVTGVSELISEQVDDRVSQLLVAGTGVSLTYNDPSGTLTIDNLHTEINILSQEPQGFVNRTDSLISFDDSSRTFTIQPAISGGSYSIYVEGTKVVKNTIETVILGSGTALNYIHFDTTSPYSVQTKTTRFDFDTDVPIAFIHWNGDVNQSTFFGEERHGIRMDSVTHKWIHNTFGIQYISGLSIGGYTLLGDGSSNTHAQIDISDGILYQEDIIIDITNDNGINSANEFVQELSPIAYIPTYYHSGSTGQWVRDIATAFPLKYNATRAQYNLYTGGTWTTPNVGDKKYFAMWIVATNDMDDPILAIVGQREDSSLTSAESNNNWNDINLTNIPTQEIRPLYRLIFTTDNTFTNTPKSSLQSILDIRVAIQSTVAGVVQNDHGILFGLADDDHFQYVHIDNNRTISALHTFSNGLNASGLINAASGNFTSLTVNSTGVSLVGHTHTSSEITDFNSSVSGLLPTISNSGNNRILTSDGTSNGIVAESGMIFNSSTKMIDVVYDTSLGDTAGTPGLRISAYDNSAFNAMGGRVIFRRYGGTESSPSGVLSNDTMGSIVYASPDSSGVTTVVARIIVSADGSTDGSNIYTPSRISFVTSSGPSQLDNALFLYSDGQLDLNGYMTIDDGLSAPTPVFDLGTISGNTAISYDVTKQIQTATLNGTAVNFTQGTGWDVANRSLDVMLVLTVTSTTTVSWTLVDDQYNAFPTFTTGTYLVLLRSIGTTIQGHYIGNKTN